MPSEHDEQAALVQWWDYSCAGFGLPRYALYAIANAGAGAQRGQAGKMKAEGVRRGIPDLCLAAPRDGFLGLYVEMKRRDGGRISPEQLEVQAYLRRAGYVVALCSGWTEAVAAIEAYLK